MPRAKKPVPTYAHHKPTDQAYVRISNGNGSRRVVYLGKYGSAESRAEYQRVLAELNAASTPSAPPLPVAAPAVAPNITINELLLAFMPWALTHYRGPDGRPTTEIHELKWSVRIVRERYGHTPATEFGPKALAAVRQEMVRRGWCRTNINRRVDRVKRVFRWAASQEFVPVTVYQALRTLPGLQKGRTDARESDPVKPVPRSQVTATLPFLTAHLRTMVELQLLTGMRPGEACALRFAEIDRAGDVWLYRPEEHKTAHRGKDRVIPIGPKARALLLTFLLRDGGPPDGFGSVDPNDPRQKKARLLMAVAYHDAGREHDAALLRDAARPVLVIDGCVVDPDAPLFSPAQARAEWARAARTRRKSKVPPSQRNRRKAQPQRGPGTEYTVAAYGYAVRKAAKKARAPHWHPNQLRHTFATEVRKSHGLEATQVLLGHSRADVTQVYAERDSALAQKVATEVG